MPHQKSHDTIPVRKGVCLNLPILEQFLRENIENLPPGPLEIMQFSAGHSKMVQTEDHQEGIAAFKEKRKPVFKGR